MSSYVETLSWCRAHALTAFPWREWVEELALAIDWPVYQLPEILDVSAAYDILFHARHFPEERAQELTRSRPGLACKRLLAGAGLDQSHQQQYTFAALYRHCARYVTGMPAGRVRAVPVDHIENVPLLPNELYAQACAALGVNDSLKQLMCWLRNVIVRGSLRATSITVKSRRKYASKRRRRGKHQGAAVDGGEHLDALQHCIQDLLRNIRQASPALVPVLACTVIHLPPARLSIGLYAQPPSLSGV